MAARGMSAASRIISLASAPQAVASQDADPELAARFAAVASALAENEAAIIEELNAAQGQAIDVGGYYNPDDALAAAAMRPSATLNGIIDAI